MEEGVVGALLLPLYMSFVVPTLEAEEYKSWNIAGVEFEDKELFDREYIQERMLKSKRAVIDAISTQLIDGEFIHLYVEPVEFSEIFVSKKIYDVSGNLRKIQTSWL